MDLFSESSKQAAILGQLGAKLLKVSQYTPPRLPVWLRAEITSVPSGDMPHPCVDYVDN